MDVREDVVEFDVNISELDAPISFSRSNALNGRPSTKHSTASEKFVKLDRADGLIARTYEPSLLLDWYRRNN